MQADASKRQPGDRPSDYRPFDADPKPAAYDRLTHARAAMHYEPRPDPYALTMGQYARYLLDFSGQYTPAFSAWLAKHA